MNTNKPIASIVIPCYNAEETIEKTINSVLNQTYTNFELIIIDDNSKDLTVKIISKFTDSRIKLFINETNLGFEGNWNKALSYASGKFIKLLPDDDTLEIKALEKQIEILHKYPNVVLVGSKRNIINKSNHILMTRGNKLGNLNICAGSNCIKYIYRYGTNPIGEPGSVLFHSSVIENGLKFNAKRVHYIDLDFYLKILNYGDYYFIDEALSNFRVWKDSYSVSHRFDNLKESLSFFDEIYQKNSSLTKYDSLISKFNIYKNWLLKNLFYFYLIKTKKI